MSSPVPTLYVLSREEVLEAEDTKFEFVKVPEWSKGNPDAGLWIKGLAGTDRDDFELNMIETKGRTRTVNLRNLRAKLVVRCAVDSNDPITAKQIFTLQDIAPLGRKSAAALQRVYSVAQRLSGLSNEEVDNLTEELGEDQRDGSGSVSLLPSGIDQSQPASVPSAVENSANGSHSTESSPSETDA